jgi:hypothetical protein
MKIASRFVVKHAFLAVPLVQCSIEGHERAAVGARLIDLPGNIDLPRGYLASRDLAPRDVPRRALIVFIVGHVITPLDH